MELEEILKAVSSRMWEGGEADPSTLKLSKQRFLSSTAAMTMNVTLVGGWKR